MKRVRTATISGLERSPGCPQSNAGTAANHRNSGSNRSKGADARLAGTVPRGAADKGCPGLPGSVPKPTCPMFGTKPLKNSRVNGMVTVLSPVSVFS